MSSNKIYTIPDYDLPSYRPSRVKKHKEKKKTPEQDPFAWSHEDRVLKDRLRYLIGEISKLKKERQEVLLALKNREVLRNKNKLREVKLYALQLEDSCWYIGMSYNPHKRLSKHGGPKGAQWTKIHPPIRLFEVRGTGKYIQDEAALLEDDMTLEYALRYGKDYVRGGGYCQAKPRWPSIILQNEQYYS